jgi:hypothetical protein
MTRMWDPATYRTPAGAPWSTLSKVIVTMAACGLVTILMLVLMIAAIPFEDFQGIDSTASGAMLLWLLAITALIGATCLSPRLGAASKRSTTLVCSVTITIFGLLGARIGHLAERAWVAVCGTSRATAEFADRGCLTSFESHPGLAFWLVGATAIGIGIAGWVLIVTARVRRSAVPQAGANPRSIA